MKTKLNNYQTIIATLLILSLTTFALLKIIHVWDFTVDDAYITLRYAKHLAQGYGIVWNIGQPSVEGYSNFSYLLLGAVLLYFKLPVIFLIKLFSVASLALTCIILYRLMRLWVNPILALLPIFLLINYLGTAIWTVSGLETPFYQLLIISTVYCIYKGLGYANTTSPNTIKPPLFLLVGSWMALASLTRPEAPAVFIVFVIGLLYYYLLNRPHLNRQSFKLALLYFCLAFIVLYIPYFSWRIYYYGRLFSNGALCKLLYPDKFILIYRYLPVAIPLLILSLPFLYRSFKTRDATPYFLLAPNLLYVMLLYGVDPIMANYNRYFLPVLPLLCAMGVLGLSRIFILLDNRNIAIILGVIITVYFYQFIPHVSLRQLDSYTNYCMVQTQVRKQVSTWLNQHVTPQQWVVIADTGLIPYYVDVNVIDSLCLNCLEFTKKPINFSYPHLTSWILTSKKPAYITALEVHYYGNSHKLIQYYNLGFFRTKILNPKEIRLTPKQDNDMLHDAEFIKNYRYVKTFALDFRQKFSYRITVFKRVNT